MKVNIYDVLDVYDKYISKNTQNKKKIYLFDKNKMQNITDIVNVLENDTYVPDKYNIFLVSEPKYRVVMSLGIKDKIINHYMAKYILKPKLEKYLDDRNVATRENKGTDYGIKLLKRYLEENKKYDNLYVLKLDIKKFFYNINHEILKSKIVSKLSSEEYKVICSIIDSTNREYVNEEIRDIVIKKASLDKQRGAEIKNIPFYKNGKGLSIGAMTSQFLSIFYTHELDHYIVHNLKVKHYVRYMDDMVLLHPDREYLKKCLKIIEEKIKEYDLELNAKKTKIINIKEGLVFLGYNFKIINKKTIIVNQRNKIYKVKKNIKKICYLYERNFISYKTVFSSISNCMYSFKYANNKVIIDYVNKVWFKNM